MQIKRAVILAVIGCCSRGVCLFGQIASDARKADPAPVDWTARQDHQNMMEQLGIKALRPGPSGNPTATNAANYDPENANPFPDLPDPLTLKNGRKITSAEMRRRGQRAET